MAGYIPIYKRRREGKTNYHTRLKLLKSNKMHLVIRKSLKNMSLQIRKYHEDGDKIILSAHTKELSKFGWKTTGGNVPSAYLTGFLLGKKALKKNIKEVIIDIGANRSTKASRIYSAIKGAIDGGMEINCDKGILPDEERIAGKHISDYASSIKDNKEAYSKYFSRYIKEGVDPSKIPEIFQSVKAKIAELK